MGLNIEALARARGLLLDDDIETRGWSIKACDADSWLVEQWRPVDRSWRRVDWWTIDDHPTAALWLLLHDVEPWPVTCPRCRGDRDKPCDCDPKTREVSGPTWSQVLLDAYTKPDIDGVLDAREQLHALADWLSWADGACKVCKGRRALVWPSIDGAPDDAMGSGTFQGPDGSDAGGWSRQDDGSWSRFCPACTIGGTPTGSDPAGPHALGEALALWLADASCSFCASEGAEPGPGRVWDSTGRVVEHERCHGTGREVVPRLRSILAALD